MTLGPRTLLLTGTWDGGTLWRAAFPALACRDGGEAVTVAPWGSPLAEAELPHAEVVVLAQLTFPSIAEGGAWLDACHARGQTVVLDVADDLLSDALLPHLRATHPAQSEAEQVAWQAQCRWLAAHVDGLTVPNAVVAERARAWTGAPIQVVPNRLAWDWWRGKLDARRQRYKEPVIGWVGAARGAADTAVMLAAWTRISRRFAGARNDRRLRGVRFVVAGWEPPALAVTVCEVRPWTDPGLYPRQWRDIDIACLPLAPTAFNAAKSELKALEAGCAGCAIVASPLVYGDVLQDGRTALLAETVDEWERALARLIQGPKLRQTLARRWAVRVERQYTLEAGEWTRWPAAWAALRAAHRGQEAA